MTVERARNNLLSWWRSFSAWRAERSKNERRTLYVVVALTLIAAIGVGGALGFAVAKTGLLWRAREQVARMFVRAAPASNAAIEWTRQTTALHTLAVARLPVGQAWMLAQADNHIVFAALQGELGYLTGNRVTGLNVAAPLGLDAFRQSRFAGFDTIDSNNIRVTDLLVIETAPHAFDLYVAHVRYHDDCFRLVVSKTELATTPASVTVAPAWTPVFETRDCIGVRATGFPYVGPSSGGRLVRFGPNALALSTGDFEFVGADLDSAVSADPNSDLGKIIIIDLANGSTRHYARGLRNPQGLMLARDGVLWETEHGPQGGDELNLIHAGVDYGWPRVSYGTPYGGAMAPSWPAGALQGEHDGYERPRFAFSPAIGISNLIQPDAREFPRWHDALLVASLRGQALHLLRLDQGAVVSDEPIAFPGHRIRDIISLADGRIAFSTDEGAIYLLANAGSPAQRPHELELVGLDTLIQPPELTAAGAYHGAHFFATQCAQCHALSAEMRAGPPLADIVGRRVGAYPGYEYSSALTGRRERWTRDRLRAFVRDPEHAYPGTHMPPPADPRLASDIVDYLANYRAPQPAADLRSRQSR